MYRFIEAEREEERSVNQAWAVLEVSRAAWYEWSKQEPSRREREDLELTEKVRTVFKSSRQTYGSPRVHSELRQRGLQCSRKRVERLMRQEGLQGRPPKRRRRTTIPDPEPPPESIDLIGRRFDPSELALNACWAGDITYVRTWEGWMYLATVIDLASRRVVGWAMADHMRAELVCEALQMAIARRRPGAGLIFHSDRGSQYTSKLFRRLLERHGIRQRLARPRQCWDNAVAEAFWSTLKIELVQRHAWPTRAMARQAVFEWIESLSGYAGDRAHPLQHSQPVAALQATIDALTQAYGSADPSAWTCARANAVSAQCNPAREDIQFQPTGALQVPGMPWVNRPTFQQVVQYPVRR